MMYECMGPEADLGFYKGGPVSNPSERGTGAPNICAPKARHGGGAMGLPTENLKI